MKGIILAGGNLVEKEGKILLVQETLEEIKGKWNLPVGRIEIGESIIACTKREGKEETGFTLDPSYLIGVYELLALGLHIILFIFKSEIIGGRLTVPEDIMDVRWFSPEEIRKMENEGLLADSYVLRALEHYQNGNRIPLGSITLLRGK